MVLLEDTHTGIQVISLLLTVRRRPAEGCLEREEIVPVKRISLFLVAMVAVLGIMALPALAYHDGGYDDHGEDGDRYGDYGDYGDYGYDDDDGNGYDDDDYNRYPPGYDDREQEPSAP